MSAPLRIVVVEDNCLIAACLAELLAGEGHEVCAIAYSEAEAIAAAARTAPDVMLVDVHLREGNGISAMRQVLAKGPMAHIYMTGDRQGVLAQIPDAEVIDKPFSTHGLRAALGRVCPAPAGTAPPLPDPADRASIAA